MINELARYGYMDELFGKPGNGETVGNYDITNLNWQKWTFNEGTVSALLMHKYNG